MRASTRRNVSYVVEASDEERAHRLGVNSLAIDPNATLDLEGESPVGGILYSAGRDGVVASWDLHMDLSSSSFPENRHADVEQQQQQQVSRPKTTCRLFSQMHTDWVNDIVLCKNGNFVISASSDRTVKLWSVREPPYNAHTVGWHKDYVKCLAAANDAGWVASGGFDKRINIWDIEHAKASLTINAESTSMHENTENSLGHSHSAASKASLYAMACNPSGSLLATGSPEKVVRLWDPRAGKQVGKLTGHTDNIRALLVSHDGTHVLSGSSDSTIKMWSVKAQRCLNTLETHPDSVWSLYSNDPELRTFYAGSRDGLVTKTQLSGHSLEEIGDDSECVALFKEKSGVVKIVAYEDKYLWTATSSSSINRWLSIPDKESRQLLTRSEYNPEIPTCAVAKLPPSKAAYHSHVLDAFLPGESLTLYSGSVMSIPISYQEDDNGSIESIEPLRTVPDGTISGKPGISSHLVLHNRRYVLAQDTQGEISLWDVVKCKQIKKFGKRKLEEVAQEVNGIESFPSWCTIDTRIGAITVQLDGFTSFDCEMYADELDLPSDYPIREDQRINLGKWVLAHLFAEFVSASVLEEEKEHEQTTERSSSVDQGGSQTPKSLHSGKPVETGIAQPPLSVVTDRSAFNSTSRAINSPTIYNGPFTAPPTSIQQPDYFSGNHHYDSREFQVAAPPPAALPSSPLTPTSTTFINRLKHLSVKSKGSKPGSDGQSSSSDMEKSSPDLKQDVESRRNSFDSKAEKSSMKKKHSSTSNASKLTPPHLSDFPPLDIPPFTTVMITEESVEASTGMDLYRGTVSSLGQDAHIIAEVAPSWLISYLYYNKTPTKEAVKITFALRPYPGSSLPEMPGGQNNRLLANRVLRVRKLIQYVADKLDIDTSQAMNELELLCGDTLLSHTMTLAAIKHHIMKSGGDVILSYRLKREGIL